MNRTDVTAYIRKSRDVPGWLHRSDALVFERLCAHQSAAGLRADLLEIGVYHGRSAILLGHFLQEGERLVVCDIFEDQPDTGGRQPASGWKRHHGGQRHYAGLTQEAFERSYRAVHPVPPVVLRCRSTELLARDLVRPPFRFVHVDGSHEPDVVVQDVATARTLLCSGGVAVFEDDHSVHQPGVPPALRAAFSDRRLRPLAITPGKTYATVGEDTPGLREMLRTWAAESAELHPVMHRIEGQPVLLLYPLPRRDGPWTGLDRKAGRDPGSSSADVG